MRSSCRRRSSQPEVSIRDIVRRLSRRPALARRYLAVEGHRALAAIEALLPHVGSIADRLRRRISHRFAGRVAGYGAEPRSDRRSAGQLRSHPRATAAGVDRSRRRLGDDASPRSARAARPDVWPSSQRTRATTTAPRDPFSSPVGGGGALGPVALADARDGSPARRRWPSGRRRSDPPGAYRSAGRPGVALSTSMAGSAEAAASEARGHEVSRVGRASPALPPGLVHGAGGRGADADDGPCRCRRRARLASAARPPRPGPRSLPPAGRRATTSTSTRPSRHASR